MEEYEEYWSGCDPLLAKPETTLHMSLVWGQTQVTFENDCYCCTVGEPDVEVVVVVVGIVVVADVTERLAAGRSELVLS